MGVPFVKVLGRVKGNVSLVYEPSAAPEVAPSVKVVVLEEGKDIFLIDLYHAYFHGTKVHCAEGEDECLLVREYIAGQGNLHGGLLLTYAETP